MPWTGSATWKSWCSRPPTARRPMRWCGAASAKPRWSSWRVMDVTTAICPRKSPTEPTSGRCEAWGCVGSSPAQPWDRCARSCGPWTLSSPISSSIAPRAETPASLAKGRWHTLPLASRSALISQGFWVMPCKRSCPPIASCTAAAPTSACRGRPSPPALNQSSIAAGAVM